MMPFSMESRRFNVRPIYESSFVVPESSQSSMPSVLVLSCFRQKHVFEDFLAFTNRCDFEKCTKYFGSIFVSVGDIGILGSFTG